MAQAKPKAGYGGISLHDQENLVQITARYLRAGALPDLATMARKSGIKELTAEALSAAVDEAKARSASLIHKEITAKARWPESK